MKRHRNAALSLKGRRQLCRRVVEENWTVSEAAAATEVSVQCARKWVGRYRAPGEAGVCDRTSAPHSIPHRTSERRIEVIATVRRLRFTRPRRPQTNGKVERFIRTLLAGWAYGAIYRTSTERTAALDGWLWHYNHHPTCPFLCIRLKRVLVAGERTVPSPPFFVGPVQRVVSVRGGEYLFVPGINALEYLTSAAGDGA